MTAAKDGDGASASTSTMPLAPPAAASASASAAAAASTSSPRKEATIRRKQSGRRAKSISELSAEEIAIAQKLALIQFTALMDRRRAVVPFHIKRGVRNAVGTLLGRWGAERPRGASGTGVP
jgi:hypothetical protein